MYTTQVIDKVNGKKVYYDGRNYYIISNGNRLSIDYDKKNIK